MKRDGIPEGGSQDEQQEQQVENQKEQYTEPCTKFRSQTLTLCMPTAPHAALC